MLLILLPLLSMPFDGQTVPQFYLDCWSLVHTMSILRPNPRWGWKTPRLCSPSSCWCPRWQGGRRPAATSQTRATCDKKPLRAGEQTSAPVYLKKTSPIYVKRYKITQSDLNCMRGMVSCAQWDQIMIMHTKKLQQRLGWMTFEFIGDQGNQTELKRRERWLTC